MVPSTDRLPKRSRLSSNSLVGPGKSSWLRVRRGSVRSDSSCSGVSSVVRGLACRPCRALVRNGSGQPPGGSPSSPSRKPITESGMSYFVGFSSKSAGSAPAPTSASARSPTTLDDGVTLTRLPRMRFAAAYMFSMSSKRSPRPRAIACWRRFDSWPPGISWK